MSPRRLTESAAPAALLLLSAVLTGCKSQAQPAAADPLAPEVGVVTVHQALVPVTTELPGRTAAYLVASAATPMATVQQIDPIYVDFNETSVEGLQLRQLVAGGRIHLNGPDQTRVRLVLEDGSSYAREGLLQFTDVSVKEGTGSMTVRAIVPNPDHLLQPGMFVRAVIDEGTNDHAMLVPKEGVTHDRNGGATVLVVGKDNKVSLRPVNAPRTLGDSWVVEGGLQDGDRVVVSGVQRVKSGMLVRAVAALAAE